MATDAEAVEELLLCAAALASPEGRRAAARRLAARFDAEDLVVFVRDPVVGLSLPAPGFPGSLPGGPLWRNLVKEATASGSSRGTLTFPGGIPSEVYAVGAADGTVAMFLGVRADTFKPNPMLSPILALLGELFRAETRAQLAEGDATLSRQSAVAAKELAGSLDSTRAELRRALTIAETATRSRDDFLATVSHELRTPLTSMIGWIQLLQDESDPELLTQGLDTIGRNARSQSRLIEDILDFSRINAGKLRLDVRPIELMDVIKAAVDVVTPAASAKGIGVDMVLDPNTGLISGDPDRLQQIIWNLLSNAAKFTPRGGRIQVRLQRILSHAVLSVSDSGQGIAPEFLPHVFDRFSQADPSSTRTHSGLGLGLGIVRHLVELHGGTVEAFSTGLGKGSTFSVRLPVILAQQETEKRDQQPSAGGTRSPIGELASSLDGISVLVVEDNDDARALLSAILQRSGATVETAECVESALQLLESGLPDIIISDIEMPGEDGYSFMRKVRLRPAPASRIPAIALTAHTAQSDRLSSLEAGFQTHMAKPVDPVELVAALKSLIATSQAAIR